MGMLPGRTVPAGSAERISAKRSRDGKNIVISLLHTIGSYPLLFTLAAQFFVLAQARESGDRLMASQAICLIGANAAASVALALRPHSPPQMLPDALGCLAALFLLTPAVVALIKLKSQQSQKQQQQAQEQKKAQEQQQAQKQKKASIPSG